MTNKKKDTKPETLPGRVYRTFFHDGEVVEIRAIGGVQGKNTAWAGYSGGRGVVCGYFDSADSFETAALALDQAGARGVYFTLNPCTPSLLARAANRLVVSPKNSTTDQEIVCYRWLPIDLDPVRPAGISSSDDELAAAGDTAKKITAWLTQEFECPDPLKACSGNGYHIMYRLPDIPVTKESGTDIQTILKALQEQFGNDRVDIDTVVHNPSRIWKIYGTTARKGDSIKDRPHRRAYLFPGQPKLLKDVSICQSLISLSN